MRRQMLVLTFAGTCVIALSAFGVPQRANLTGAWILRTSGSAGTTAVALTLAQQGELLSGTSLAPTGARRDVIGRVAGDSVVFSIPIMASPDRNARYTGALASPDSVVGEVELAGRGRATFTAVRQR